MPAKATKDQLSNFFKQYGTVISIRHPAASDGRIALVQFDNPQGANKATAQKQRAFYGSVIKLSLANINLLPPKLVTHQVGSSSQTYQLGMSLSH